MPGNAKIRRDLLVKKVKPISAPLDMSTFAVKVNPRLSVNTASTGTNISGSGFYIVNNSTSTAAGFSNTYTLSAPTAGDRVILFVQTFNTSTGTDNVKVQASSTGAVKFDGTNYVATMTAADEGFEIVALSTARWAVLGQFPSSTGPSFGTS